MPEKVEKVILEKGGGWGAHVHARDKGEREREEIQAANDNEKETKTRAARKEAQKGDLGAGPRGGRSPPGPSTPPWSQKA